MDDFKQKLLDYYSLTEEDFISLSKPISEIRLIDPNKIKGMDKVKDRIFQAIKNNEKIIIYGDYDCDGVSATSIMVLTFEKLAYPVSYYIPSRYMDGYGLNVTNVRKIKEKGFNLIITVDNGISANEAIDEANNLGMDVIVIDHHELPETPVNAVGVIHPLFSEISEIIGSGGYMSLFVSAALLDRYDDYLVTIAGMSTISDMMMLKDYNRDVVRLALYNLNKYRYQSLMNLTDSDVIDEKTFSLEICPKINAIARLVTNKNVNLLVKYLTSQNIEEQLRLRDWIIENNEARKELTKQAIEKLPTDIGNQKGIVLKLDLLEGLIGLIANRLLNQYNLPTIIFTEDENDPTILKGSIRSKEGFNVTKAFDSLNKYLLTGGGHALAGGLSIKKDDFESFKQDFLNLCEQYPVSVVEKPSIEISLKDITLENYKILREFSPFGIGNEEPLFKIKNLPTRGLTFISYGKHLSTQLSISTKLLGFNMPETEIKRLPFMDITGNFILNTKYGKTLEFRINDYKLY